MKKFLLLSDTHGNLSQLDMLIKETKPDAVIHAGDFGFYDNESINRLQTRELRLLITHSSFRNQYSITKQTERSKLIEIILKHKLLGDFPDYLEGKKTFPVPVYAIWGNHEDLEVVSMLRKDLNIKNLYIIDDQHHYEIDPGLLLYGIGGNWISGKKLFDEPIAGSGGKIWATFSQFGSLYKQVKKYEGSSIFVSHISPGKEPLLVRLMTHFNPNLWISGHMDPPYSCLWNPFTVRNEQEQNDWLSQNIPLELPLKEISGEALLAYELIHKPLPSFENWFKKQWYLNLSDADNGHAILTLKHRHLTLQTYSHGILY